MSFVRLPKRFAAVLLATAVLAGACSAGGGDSAGSAETETPDAEVGAIGLEVPEGFGSGTLTVRDSSGETLRWPVLVAADRESRRRGLMGVTDLGGWAGMAFVFDTDVTNSFWMKDTLIPLTVVYVNGDGAVVSTSDMEPCAPGTACPAYAPGGPYRMAFEAVQGDLDRLGIGTGALLSLETTTD